MMRLATGVKINLGLRVLRRRPDGYHDIETLFYPCPAPGDRLEMQRARSFSLQIDGPCYTGWDPSEDLCARAWRLMAGRYRIPPVEIRLHKTAPVGAGLGGGSADAAAVLCAIDALFTLHLGEDRLAALAAELGSDCPFFVYNRPMLGEGRGEVLTPFALDLSAYDIRIAVPEGVSVSTAEAYRGVLDAARPNPGLPLRDALRRPVAEWREVLHNDFEDTVFPRHEKIAALKRRFYEQGAVYAAMSGSGSAVFGLFPR